MFNFNNNVKRTVIPIKKKYYNYRIKECSRKGTQTCMVIFLCTYCVYI